MVGRLDWLRPLVLLLDGRLRDTGGSGRGGRGRFGSGGSGRLLRAGRGGGLLRSGGLLRGGGARLGRSDLGGAFFVRLRRALGRVSAFGLCGGGGLFFGLRLGDDAFESRLLL